MLKLSSFILCIFLSSSLVSYEKADPMDGSRNLMLYLDFVYLKRQAKIQERCIVRVEDGLPEGIAPGIIPDPNNPGFNIEEPIPSSCARGKCKVTTKDLLHKQGFDPGFRVTADYMPNKKVTLQATYTGLLDWKGERSANCPDSLEFPFQDHLNNTVDYQNANIMRTSLRSNYWNLEANYWYHVTPRRIDEFALAWLFGFRYLNFRENFHLKTETNTQASDFKINVKNRMGGLQLGIDFEGNIGPNFTWGILPKLGAIVDFAENHTVFKDNNNTQTLKSYNPSDFFMSFVGDFSTYFLFNLYKNLIFKFSYEVTYASNIALALNQIDFREDNISDIQTHIESGRSLMLQGLYVSFGIHF